MKLTSLAFAVIAGLGAGSISACSHGNCWSSAGPGGKASCAEGGNSAACATIQGCRWDTRCTVKRSCNESDAVACQARGECEWDGAICYPRASLCPSLSGEECTNDTRCMQAPGCIGTPRPCEDYDDEDECIANQACRWSPTPAI